LRTAYLHRQIAQGRASDDPTQEAITDFLHSPKPQDVIVAPVCIGEKVVNLLCLHSAEGTTFGSGILEELSLLCAKAASHYVRLLRGLKQS
jgi:transcriptional regulator with GAF, ATPase, and Fis domain